jgi:hypothetical protein
VGLWSQLLRDDPQRLEIELARAGTTLGNLVRDIRDVPELRDKTARMSRKAKELLALEYFGDQGNPQPEDRTAWVRASSPTRVVRRRTPDFRRLPSLDDPAEPEAQRSARMTGRHDRVPGEIPTRLVEQAVRWHVKEGLGRRTLAQEVRGLTEWTAGQILRWYGVGKPAGLWLDEQRRLRWGAAVSPVWRDEGGREQVREHREQRVSPTPVALRLPRL